MLKKLRIKNFKLWEDTGEIDMKPLTLFFGTNSSGKSSIGQFLMMLKQTAQSSDRQIVLYSGTKDTPIQVGSFSEYIHQHDPGKALSFEYVWQASDEIILPGTKTSGQEISFTATVHQSSKNLSAPYISMFSYSYHNGGESPIKLGMKREDSKGKYDLLQSNVSFKRNVGRAWGLPDPIRYYGFPDEVIAYYQDTDTIQNLNLANEYLFKNLYYLGPLRQKPERLYMWAGNRPESVGYSGENTISAILSAKERKLNFGVKKRYLDFEVALATELIKMGLIHEFRVKPISKNRQEYEVQVKTIGSSEYVTLPDVGFGVSQVLPVLTQLFYAPSNSIIIMEQPEIHLHPSAQAALADVMIDAINARENGKPRNIQLIIETHSEHFLNRLCRRIAEQKVSHDQVSMSYATVRGQKAVLRPLDVNFYGEIQNWPPNFFGDEMADIAGRAEAAIQRKREQAQS